MTRLQQFALPDLGEGLTEGEILRWLVAPGEQVRLNQPLVEVETAKAAVEVPSPYAGVVVEVHHAAGETVDVGSALITIDTDPAPGALPDSPAGEPGPAAQAGALIGEVGPGGRTATLVGYGPKTAAAARRPRKDGPTSSPAGSAASAVAPSGARVASAAVAAEAAVAAQPSATVLAKPPVRRLARQVGVELSRVTPTGPHGSITRADVTRSEQAGQESPDPATRPRSRGDALRGERRVPVRGVRKMTAAAMVQSAFTAPHVTEFLTVDVTATMDLKARLQAMPEFADLRVTPLLLVARALLMAVRRHPDVNASWDEPAQEIVVKNYVHLGIAAATPRGLLVPNIKDADQLGLADLARALDVLTAVAREGRTSNSDMAGGTITITNVGTFGVDTGTPILNPGESAILCLGVVRPMPWVVEGQVVVRQVTQLALSFDHRSIDGQLGSQFLADIGRILTEPAVAFAWS